MNKENKLLNSLLVTALLLTVALAITLALLCSSLSFISKATDEDLVDIELGDDTAYNKGEVGSGVEIEDGVITETDLPISLFRDSYVNKTGLKIAESANGDNIIAPGIEFSYRFRLRNTGAGKVDYSFAINGQDENEEGIKIPVEYRLKSADGNYIIGSADEWVGLDALSGIREDGDLGINVYSTYVLDWRWANTGTVEGDEFDTSLGNMAIEKDLTLSLNIKATAYANDGSVASFLARVFLDENGETNLLADITVGGVVASLIGASAALTAFIVIKIKRRIKRSISPDGPDYYMYY